MCSAFSIEFWILYVVHCFEIILGTCIYIYIYKLKKTDSNAEVRSLNNLLANPLKTFHKLPFLNTQSSISNI